MNVVRLIPAILISLFFQTEPVDCESCPASTPTIKEVKECPQSAEEWRKASETKQCERMKSHNCKSFVYHCLMNQKEDAFLEVCAPTWFMSGFCAMFNTEEERVIDNFKLDCTNFTEGEKCPTRFISTEAYKYQQCYEHVLQKIQNSNTTKLTAKAICEDGESASSGSGSNTSLIVAIVAVVIFSVLDIILLVILFLIRKQINWRKVLSKKDKTPMERSPRQQETESLLNKDMMFETDVEIGNTSWETNSEQEVETQKRDIQKGSTTADAQANRQKELNELQKKGKVKRDLQQRIQPDTKKNPDQDNKAKQEDRAFKNDVQRGSTPAAIQNNNEKSNEVKDTGYEKSGSSESEPEKNKILDTAKKQIDRQTDTLEVSNSELETDRVLGTDKSQTDQETENQEVNTDVALSATGDVNEESESLKVTNTKKGEENVSSAVQEESRQLEDLNVQDSCVQNQVNIETQRNTDSDSASSPSPNKSQIEKDLDFLKSQRLVQKGGRSRDSNEDDAASSLPQA